MKTLSIPRVAIFKRLWYQIARRLWCQLALSYIFLTFFAMMFLGALLYTLDDYRDFRAVTNRENIEYLLSGEKNALLKALGNMNHHDDIERLGDDIINKLYNIEKGEGSNIYRVRNSSNPQIYVQISDWRGSVLFSNSDNFSDTMGEFLNDGSIRPPEVDTPLVLDMPVANERGESIGRLRVLYIARFDPMVQLTSIVGFLGHIWISVFICSVPIGIACGLIGSRYVTRQLQTMNQVTERWRQGDFTVRISLPNDDVLIRHSQNLNEMAQDLQMYLTLKQDLAVNRERNRVARELHDTVKQKLFALGLQLATAKSKPAVMDAAREQVLEAEAITREAQRDLLDILTQLLPAARSDASFQDRIGSVADDMQRRFGVSIEIDHTAFVPMDAQTQHQVLRIVQEALINAVRHGKATRILIICGLDGAMARIRITDNGAGFDTTRNGQGFGMVSMRDRSRDLPCGAFNVTSAIGVGTEVTLAWKIEP